MKPQDESGPLKRFIERRVPGLHHLGLRTEDIREDAQALTSQGVRFIRPLNDFPEDGEIRALIHPREGEGVLVELLERPKRDD